MTAIEDCKHRLSADQLELFARIMKDDSWYLNGASLRTGSHPPDYGHQTWRKMRWFVFDVETTSLVWADEWEKTPEPEFGVFQLYAEVLDNRVKEDAVAVFCDPTVPMHEEAQQITGMTDDRLAGLPLMEEFLPRVIRMIERCDLLLAYNARFDITCMIYEMVAAGYGFHEIKSVMDRPFLDPMPFERARRQDNVITKIGRHHKLSDICSRFGVSTMSQVAHGELSLHDASVDVTNLVALMDPFSEHLPWSLEQLIEKQSHLIRRQDFYIRKKFGPRPKKEK